MKQFLINYGMRFRIVSSQATPLYNALTVCSLVCEGHQQRSTGPFKRNLLITSGLSSKRVSKAEIVSLSCLIVPQSIGFVWAFTYLRLCTINIGLSNDLISRDWHWITLLICIGATFVTITCSKAIMAVSVSIFYAAILKYKQHKYASKNVSEQ